MTRALIFLCALAGCSVRTQGQASSGRVQVVVSDPEALNPAGRLGVAVVWVGNNGLEVTASALVPDAGGVTVPVEAPADAARLGLTPVDALQLAQGTPMYRPRLVVFEDTNRSGAFEFDGLDAGAGDRVWAADDADGVGYLLDLEGMLSSVSSSETDRYYASTGGLYTPYVPTAADSSGAFQLAPDAPITLSLGEGPSADTSVGCERSVTEPQLSLDNSFAVPPTVFVNTGIDLGPVCAATTSQCQQSALALLPAPPHTTFEVDDHWQVVECRRSGLLESTIVFDSRHRCAGCSCAWQGVKTVYVAATTALPPWWPCGLSVPYCNETGTLLSVSFTCINP